MGDPRFERTVILIVEHGPDGTLGIVIDKPIREQPLASVFKALGQKDGDVTGSVRVFGFPTPVFATIWRLDSSAACTACATPFQLYIF